MTGVASDNAAVSSVGCAKSECLSMMRRCQQIAAQCTAEPCFSNYVQVRLTGGEPTIRSDFGRILEDSEVV